MLGKVGVTKGRGGGGAVFWPHPKLSGRFPTQYGRYACDGPRVVGRNFVSLFAGDLFVPPVCVCVCVHLERREGGATATLMSKCRGFENGGR